MSPNTLSTATFVSGTTRHNDESSHPLPEHKVHLGFSIPFRRRRKASGSSSFSLRGSDCMNAFIIAFEKSLPPNASVTDVYRSVTRFLSSFSTDNVKKQ